MAEIQEQLELIKRDVGFMLERLSRADINVSDKKRILSNLRKARQNISTAMHIM